MRIKTILAAVGIAVAAMSVSGTAQARDHRDDRRYDHDRRWDGDRRGYDDRRWDRGQRWDRRHGHHRVRCWKEWRHHHRVKVCR